MAGRPHGYLRIRKIWSRNGQQFARKNTVVAMPSSLICTRDQRGAAIKQKSANATVLVLGWSHSIVMAPRGSGNKRGAAAADAPQSPTTRSQNNNKRNKNSSAEAGPTEVVPLAELVYGYNRLGTDYNVYRKPVFTKIFKRVGGWFPNDWEKCLADEEEGLSKVNPKDLSLFLTDLVDGYTKYKEHSIELKKKRMELQDAQTELANLQNTVDEPTLKTEIIRLADGKVLMPLFRGCVFLSMKYHRTSDLVSPSLGGVVPGHHLFPDKVFDHAFKILQTKNASLAKSYQDSAKSLGRTIYSDGAKHAYNNPEKRNKLWVDKDFSQELIKKFNHKRNQQAGVYRGIFGECASLAYASRGRAMFEDTPRSNRLALLLF
jgi:hypothetical protein